jgi:beta-glucosidase
VLEDRGGWLARETAEAFAEYTEAVLARLGDRVQTWMTLNEPYVSAHIGYAHGRHAPGHTDLASALTASHHLLFAHGLALERIRALAPGAEAGVVVNFTPLEPDTTDQADIDATRRENDIENRWYSDPIGGLGYPAETAESLGWDQAEVLDGDLERIAAPIDVFGVNFYTRRFISATGREPAPRGPVTDMGWEIHPPALGRLLRDLHARHGFPKYLITENGCAMPDATRDADGRVVDTDRVAYLASHLHEVRGAIEDGVPVAGYFAWSLMDNFEWGYGYEKRFGLVEVDYSTLERRPKHSALWYSEVMATGLVSTQEP